MISANLIENIVRCIYPDMIFEDIFLQYICSMKKFASKKQISAIFEAQVFDLFLVIFEETI